VRALEPAQEKQMPHAVEVLVVRRNLRWEVRVNGVARPLIDWLCTKDRAIEHARDRAREVDARVVLIEGADWTVEEVIHVDRDSGRYARAA
jgi:hypothetical protein